MTPEHAGRGKFSQFVTHHVLGDIYRDELVAIVHGDGVAYKIR